MNKQIEFDKIKEMWEALALTGWAKEKIQGADICLSEDELRKELRDTSDGRELMEKLGTPPLQNVEEIKEVILAAEQGNCLTPYQFERTEKFLTATRRLKDYLERGKMYNNPLSYYEENLDALDDLKEEIRRQIRGGAVDDSASRELLHIRNQIAKCEEQMKQKAEQIMRSKKEYMADNYCTFRNERICVPVKREHKLKVPGIIMDKSATGGTLFIEPSGAARFYEEIQQLKISEENEIYRILYTLTAMVADSAAALTENIRLMEKLDFIFSKGKLSMDMNAVEPSLHRERKIVLKSARHPLMDRDINVPLQFAAGDGIRGVIITGPNTGGKTVAIKTVMLVCMMAQCGLHVPCREASLCMFSSYLCDIGDGQNIAENLSTFSAHIKNILDILHEVNKDSLVIMDELGSGTDPAEGMGIAVSVLEELKKSGCMFLVTTHYPEVKEYAEKTPDIINARMTFDKETLMPTYQLVIGEAGESCAFYIADKLGMPGHMLKTAVRAAYGDAAADTYTFASHHEKPAPDSHSRSRLSMSKSNDRKNSLYKKYQRGDSVMVYPDKKIGIVCEPINEKGVLRVQLPGKKIWINHKRVKLQVSATELYPEDYDFSILFDSVVNRKIRHEMERKYTEETIQY